MDDWQVTVDARYTGIATAADVDALLDGLRGRDAAAHVRRVDVATDVARVTFTVRTDPDVDCPECAATAVAVDAVRSATPDATIVAVTVRRGAYAAGRE